MSEKTYTDGTVVNGPGQLPTRSPRQQDAEVLLRLLNDVESMLGGTNGLTIQLRAALAAAPAQERIDALELEVRQLTEKVAALRHAIRSQQLAPSAAPAEQQMVAYLDIGAGGYIDLGSELPDETLLRLPKGRHALVIAGTFGIDGYVAAAPKPAPSAAPAEADGWCAHYLPCECAPEAREGCVSWRKRNPSLTPQADSQPAQAQAGAAPRYRLLVRGRDTIQADDEFLREDGATWLKDPSGIFVGCMYEGTIFLPARRAIDEARGIKGGQHGTE